MLYAPLATANVPALTAAVAMLNQDDGYGLDTVSTRGDVLVIGSIRRLFAEGYASGYWPGIRLLLETVLPHAPGLVYSSDCEDAPDDATALPRYGLPVTAGLFVALDDLWATVVDCNPDRA